MFSFTDEKLKTRDDNISKDSLGETTPLASYQKQSSAGNDEDDDDDDYGGEVYFSSLKGYSVRRESIAADRLSMRLLAIDDDDSAAEDIILKETLDLGDSSGVDDFADRSGRSQSSTRTNSVRLCGMVGVAIAGLGVLVAAFVLGVQFIGPPNQPVGPYQLIERQVRNWDGVMRWTSRFRT
jgi:hypothetical protein